jgi:hypothetical protein
MDNQISSVTRKDLFDELSNLGYLWYGRLDEIQFLNRLYNLKKLPSLDERFKNAQDDIWQHCINNPQDWDNWWVLNDKRFDLLHCPDEDFFKFICEMIHPNVRNEKEVNEILPIINKYLNKDNFELYPEKYISGRPVFGYRKKDAIKQKTIENVKTIKDYLSTEYIDNQIQTIEKAIDDNPDLAIGTAKELIETICKSILEENNLEINEKDKYDVPKILKKTLEVLQLLPKDVDNNKKGAESIKKILGGLTTIVQGLAELRNEYGTGHGKNASFKGLQPRHAKLAANAASAVAYFLLEAHKKNQ